MDIERFIDTRLFDPMVLLRPREEIEAPLLDSVSDCGSVLVGVMTPYKSESMPMFAICFFVFYLLFVCVFKSLNLK